MTKTILICFLSFLTKLSFAQTISPDQKLITIPPSPEASSLFKFLETPVSEFTGIPNINIPIYEIKLGKFSFPISLKYHSSGYKVEEQSGNIGLGWAIEAGGQISSTVIGKPDFQPYGYGVVNTIPQTRSLNPQKILIDVGHYSENADYSLLMSLFGNPALFNTAAGAGNIVPDTQPDIFYYSMFDRGGKFFYGVNQIPHTIPYSNIKIERDLPNGTTFRITDEQGTIFVFGASDQTNVTTVGTTTNPVFGGGGNTVVNQAFYLTQIITLTQDTLDITYNNCSYTYKNIPSYTRYRSVPGVAGCVNQDAVTTIESTANVQNGKFIKEITSNRGHRVEFIYDANERMDLPGTYALNRIEVYKGSHLESYDLTHEYYNQASGQTDKDNLKLKLKGVQKSGENPYVFNYFNDDGTFPSRFSTAKDNWGYYNGLGGTFPADPLFGFDSGDNKAPDLSHASKGILQKITYPTGGSTAFEYESNMFAETSSVPISTTIDGQSMYFDSTNPAQQINFDIPATVINGSMLIKYNCTSGTFNPQFEVLLTGDNYIRAFTGQSSSSGEFIALQPGHYTMKVSSQNGSYEEGFFSLFWQTLVNGPETTHNTLGGGLRIKSIKDYSNNSTLVKTRIYTYNLSANPSFSSGQVFNKPSYSYIYNKTDHIVDFLSGGSVYRENTCSFYTQTSGSNLPLSGMQNSNVFYTEIQKQTIDENAQDNGYTRNYYSFEPDLKAYSGYPFTPATSYEWMSGNLIKSEIYKISNGMYKLQKRVTNTYNYNYTLPDPTTNDEYSHLFTIATKPNETHLVAANISLERPEITVSSYAGTITYPALFNIEYYKLISAWTYLSHTTEETFEGNSISPVITDASYSYDNPAHAQLTNVQSTSSNGKKILSLTTYPQDYASGTAFISDLISKHNFTLPIEKVSYQLLPDNTINILQGSLTEYLTGGKGLISNVFKTESLYPIPLNSFKISNSVAGSLPNYSNLSYYSKDNRYQLKVSVSNYDNNNNPLQATPAFGAPITYLWGYNNRYPIAEIKNADYNSVASALNNAGINIIAFCNRTSISLFDLISLRAAVLLAFPNAQMMTYTFDPLVGMTSMTDSKGMTTTYEYDSFQRLMNVKDANGKILKHTDYHYKQ